MIERIVKASYQWNRVIMVMASIFILAMMFLVAADVSGRYFLGQPITGATEIGQMMLAYVAFLSISYGLVKGTHVRVTLLFRRFSPQLKMAAELLAGVGGIAFFTVLLWGGSKFFWDSWTVKEVVPAALRLPYWISKLALPIGAMLVIIQFIIYTVHQVNILSSERGEE